MDFNFSLVAFYVMDGNVILSSLRLFVYHVENIEKKEFVEIVKIQEYKIYKYIGLPAKIATILSELQYALH